MNSHILLCFVYHIHDILCCIKEKRLDFRSVVFKCKFGPRPRHKAQYRTVVNAEPFGGSCNLQLRRSTFYHAILALGVLLQPISWRAGNHPLSQGRVRYPCRANITARYIQRQRRVRAWDKHVPFSLPSSPLGKLISPWRGATWTSEKA